MWSRGVTLDRERVSAWWSAMEPFLKEMDACVGSADRLEASFAPASVAKIAGLFGIDETVGSAAFAVLEGGSQGLMMFCSDTSGQQVIESATEVFSAFARGVGGHFDAPWALVDMRSTLAGSLAAQTGSLHLAAMVTLRWPDGLFCFVPDWRQWNVRYPMEVQQEAA